MPVVTFIFCGMAALLIGEYKAKPSTGAVAWAACTVGQIIALLLMYLAYGVDQ